eukprot:tig00020553_g10590.t1
MEPAQGDLDDDDAFWNNLSPEEEEQLLKATSAGRSSGSSVAGNGAVASATNSHSAPISASTEAAVRTSNTQPQANGSAAFSGHQRTSSVARSARTNFSGAAVSSGSAASSSAGSAAVSGHLVKGLNDEQAAVVAAPLDQPLLVIASAGSGKTSTIVRRIQRIVEETKNPEALLCISFSTAAASELKARLQKQIGRAASRIRASTFHSFALSICREFVDRIPGGYTKDFSCASGFQQREFVKEGILVWKSTMMRSEEEVVAVAAENSMQAEKRARLENKVARWLLDTIQRKKNGGYVKLDEQAAFVAAHYERRMQESNCMERVHRPAPPRLSLPCPTLLDFVDMVEHARNLLVSCPDIAAAVSSRFRDVVVDEVQDTSRAQLTLLTHVASHGHLTAVGDDDQTIYRFSGACDDNFARLRIGMGSSHTVTTMHLSTNYRSTGCIVEAASALIKNNQRRELKRVAVPPEKRGGIQPVVCEARTADCEASFLIRKITELKSQGRSLDSVAVLARTRVACQEVESALGAAGIPVAVRGCSRKPVQDLIHLLALVLNEKDDGAFRALTLTSGLFHEKRAREAISAHAAAREIPLLKTARELLEMHPAGKKGRGKGKGKGKGRGAGGAGGAEGEGEEEGPFSSHARGRLAAIVDAVHTVRFRYPRIKLSETVGRVCIDVLMKLSHGRGISFNAPGRGGEESLRSEMAAFAEDFLAGYEGPRGDEHAEAVLRAFLDRLTQAEEEREKTSRAAQAAAVTVSTVHGAKGLEWDTVFVYRLNDGEFPVRNPGEEGEVDPTHLEDERRLVFVAMTRARTELYLSHAISSPDKGQMQPSVFLREIPHSLLHPAVAALRAGRSSGAPLAAAFAQRAAPGAGPGQGQAPAQFRSAASAAKAAPAAGPHQQPQLQAAGPAGGAGGGPGAPDPKRPRLEHCGG